MGIRADKVESTIQKCLDEMQNSKLSREETLVLLAQLLIRSGYSFYYQFENKISAEDRPNKISHLEVQILHDDNPTTGTTLMKLGFDIQEKLLI